METTKIKEIKKTLGLWNDAKIVIKALNDYPQQEVSKIKLLAFINSGLKTVLVDHRFGEVWKYFSKLSMIETRRDPSLKIKKLHTWNPQYAAVAISKAIGVSQRGKALVFMREMKVQEKDGLVNIKGLEKWLKANYNFILTAEEISAVQKVLREEVSDKISLRKRSNERIEFINPDKIGYDEIFSILVAEKGKKPKVKEEPLEATIVPPVKEDMEEPVKEIAIVTGEEIMAIVNAIEVVYRRTGHETKISDLPKLIENWSYMIIPEFRIRDILNLLEVEMPGEIVREDDTVCLGNYQAFKKRYFQGLPWEIVLSSDSLTLEELNKVLSPESIKSSGQYKGLNIYSLRINRDFKGIQEGMGLVKILRSSDYISDPEFVKSMVEKLQVQASHYSKTKEIYESL